ncbi:NUDIX domain-containing protein [Deinococcus alpinitundrae]|uniref:NUDIX domain-containing protein n=1 Tax=Deinococcus alpinitundrae TaxID=468913 RepID=UPI00137ABDA2|nr:NUDIX domain-containing protein [Deinococcus alpinitundrae]
MATLFSEPIPARAHAQRQQLRAKAVCSVTQGTQLLVFDPPLDDSGAQIPAGGVAVGETPFEAASREVREETGRGGPKPLRYLGSAVRINTEHAKHERRDFFYLAAPPDSPGTWDHPADGQRFRFRWVPLSHLNLD